MPHRNKRVWIAVLLMALANLAAALANPGTGTGPF